MDTYHSGKHMVDPSVLFRKGQLQPGMHIADLGCGRTGHIVFPASEIIGEDGIIYAVDILKDALKMIRKRAKRSNIRNIHTVWADLEQVGHTSIPDSSLDVAYLTNTLYQSDNQQAIIKESSRLMKDKARFVVADWSNKNISFGPDEGEYVDFENIKKLTKQEGFTVQEEFELGDYHTGIVFYRHE